MKDRHNALYDPRQANNVCVGGQLLLLDLIERLEDHCDIIQSNTDGILIKLRRYEDFDLIDDICWEWEVWGLFGVFFGLQLQPLMINFSIPGRVFHVAGNPAIFQHQRGAGSR
mgnify:CR=1 FL=1